LTTGSPTGFDRGNGWQQGNLFAESIRPTATDVVVSVTEGEDKPLKYPPMFKFADVVLFTKLDVLAGRAERCTCRCNPWRK
jgi:Ni2+-binding GTPase involved in maturation of urease and hydrogenase